MEARRVLQMAPQSLKATLLLADIAWQRGDLEEFAEWFHQAQRLDLSGVVARRVWGDQHPLLHVLKVDPPLPMEEAGRGEGAQDEYAKEHGTPRREENTLPPDNPPWLLDSHLPWTGLAPSLDRLKPEGPSRAADPIEEAAARSQPSPSAHEAPRQPGEGGLQVSPLGWSWGVDIEPQGDDEVGSTPPAPSTPLQAAPPRGLSESLGLQPQVQADQDEELAEIELELKRIASSLSLALSPSESQPLPTHKPTQRLEAPLGLIVSNRTALEAKYGSAGASRIHRALTELADAMSDKGRMQALVLYLDDRQSLRPYGLAPADPKDPQELKFTLNRLEERLRDGRRGGREQAVTYLLLIGGDDIVPFHPLPDPNEDELVLSDHPYACLGDNYRSFERAVGRLPDGVSRDLGFLLRLIAAATEAHRSPHRRSSLWQGLGGWLGWTRRACPEAFRRDGAVTSLGYTASIWRRAAREVFSSIGQTNLLRISPPLTCEEMPSLGPIAPRFSYFNLHGLRDSAYWYGQRDPTYAADYPLFPVAVKPSNIPVVPHPQAIVFSEACYGAHILNKDQMSSLALRFLATQALGVVGSTALAYGAVDSPLVGADLLAKAFWERVKAGYPLGEALRQAKQALAQGMLALQGYLDPEDQKTILSFVLYGDPTLVVEAGSGDDLLKPSSKRGREVRDPEPALRQAGMGSTGDELTASTLCRRQILETGLISPQLMAHVQHRLASCLPPAIWRDVIVSAQTLCRQKRCNGQCSLRQAVAKGRLPAQAKLVFTLRQKCSTPEDHVHQQIFKVTVDSQGNLVKIAISR